ncbi:NadE [Desulforapulum autotrophicum HRM2]|uniref:Glutamine-dependent NAD(+) synthetase n=1 Tax=Desulforapulum autotrophicum (strain ATCC 43914 / DSM 3382 / VKM B-1955 / HRM2) TaxID=177437 RepID=C0QAL7_DESAH|nr:NAD+ synthase [Desulforapulum autotrophicum]ACN16800.1 NadE [Desulforapulum autotrophicum HRM2]
MKIAMAQTNPVIGDFDFNIQAMIKRALEARALGCELIVFPELSISGYPPGDLLERNDFIDNQLNALQELIHSIRGIGVLCGVVNREICQGERRLFNSALLFEEQNILARTDKQLLPTYDIFDELRYFTPGPKSSLISYKGLNLGITICEDIWNDEAGLGQKHYDRNPVADLASLGADLFINIAASPFHGGKQDLRNTLLKKITAHYNRPLIFVNQVGGNDSTLFDGLSLALTAQGEVAARAMDFSEDLVVFDTTTQKGDCHGVSTTDDQAILKALVMGTRDYVTKCGFKQAIIGSSGGIDSALTAAIAVAALGRKNVKTIFMPSIYTSKQNIEDTKALALNLGISWQSIPIAPMYDAFLTLSDTFNPENPGITEQNIQARIRGTILMAFSNKEGSMLLATGNKSEMAVGYSTLYGDMCGGLAVIGDLPKKKVYEISRLINRERKTIPLSILEKAPSAELAPDQTDQDDLPSYDIIDAVVKAHVEDHQSIEDMVTQGLDRSTVNEIVQRITRNEYKRYQAPPILRVTAKAFGAGRRHPMAQRYRP